MSVQNDILSANVRPPFQRKAHTHIPFEQNKKKRHEKEITETERNKIRTQNGRCVPFGKLRPVLRYKSVQIARTQAHRRTHTHTYSRCISQLYFDKNGRSHHFSKAGRRVVNTNTNTEQNKWRHYIVLYNTMTTSCSLFFTRSVIRTRRRMSANYMSMSIVYTIQ